MRQLVRLLLFFFVAGVASPVTRVGSSKRLQSIRRAKTHCFYILGALSDYRSFLFCSFATARTARLAVFSVILKVEFEYR